MTLLILKCYRFVILGNPGVVHWAGENSVPTQKSRVLLTTAGDLTDWPSASSLSGSFRSAFDIVKTAPLISRLTAPGFPRI